MDSRCHVDFIDYRLSPDGEYKFVLVYLDVLSKFNILKALKSKSPEEIADNLIDIFTLIGAPNIIQSSERTEFIIEIVENLKTLWPDLKILYGNSTQTRQSSHNRRIVKRRIRKYCKRYYGIYGWSKVLRYVQLTRNRTVRSHIRKSPFELLFGRSLELGLVTFNLPFEVLRNINSEDDLGKILARTNMESVNNNSVEEKATKHLENTFVDDCSSTTMDSEEFTNFSEDTPRIAHEVEHTFVDDCNCSLVSTELRNKTINNVKEALVQQNEHTVINDYNNAFSSSRFKSNEQINNIEASAKEKNKHIRRFTSEETLEKDHEHITFVDDCDCSSRSSFTSIAKNVDEETVEEGHDYQPNESNNTSDYLKAKNREIPAENYCNRQNVPILPKEAENVPDKCSDTNTKVRKRQVQNITDDLPAKFRKLNSLEKGQIKKKLVGSLTKDIPSENRQKNRHISQTACNDETSCMKCEVISDSEDEILIISDSEDEILVKQEMEDCVPVKVETERNIKNEFESERLIKQAAQETMPSEDKIQIINDSKDEILVEREKENCVPVKVITERNSNNKFESERLIKQDMEGTTFEDETGIINDSQVEDCVSNCDNRLETERLLDQERPEMIYNEDTEVLEEHDPSRQKFCTSENLIQKPNTCRKSNIKKPKLQGDRTILIQNLPHTVQNADLKDLLIGFEKIKNIRLTTRKKPSGLRTNGFITFWDFQSALKALKIQGMYYGGRYLEVSMLKDIEKDTHDRAVVVKNIPSVGYEEDILWSLFKPFGLIRSVHLIDGISKKTADFALIIFESFILNNFVAQLQGLEIDNCLLKINRCGKEEFHQLRQLIVKSKIYPTS